VEEIGEKDFIKVYYKTRVWTVQKLSLRIEYQSCKYENLDPIFPKPFEDVQYIIYLSRIKE
jgi:hypothetical protein